MPVTDFTPDTPTPAGAAPAPAAGVTDFVSDDEHNARNALLNPQMSVQQAIGDAQNIGIQGPVTPASTAAANKRLADRAAIAQQQARNAGLLKPAKKPTPPLALNKLDRDPGLQQAAAAAHGMAQGSPLGLTMSTVAGLGARFAPPGSIAAQQSLQFLRDFNPDPTLYTPDLSPRSQFYLNFAGQLAGGAMFGGAGGEAFQLFGAPIRAAVGVTPGIRAFLPAVETYAAGRTPGFLTRGVAANLTQHALSTGSDIWGMTALQELSDHYDQYAKLAQQGRMTDATTLFLKRTIAASAPMIGLGMTGAIAHLRGAADFRRTVDAAYGLNTMQDTLAGQAPDLMSQMVARNLIRAAASGEMTQGAAMETLRQFRDDRAATAIAHTQIPAYDPNAPHVLQAHELQPEQMAAILTNRQRPVFGQDVADRGQNAQSPIADKYVRSGSGAVTGEQPELPLKSGQQPEPPRQPEPPQQPQPPQQPTPGQQPQGAPIPLRSLRYHTDEAGRTTVELYYPKLVHVSRDELVTYAMTGRLANLKPVARAGEATRSGVTPDMVRVEVTPDTSNYPLIHDTILPRIPDAAIDKAALAQGRTVIDLSKLTPDQQLDLLKAGAEASIPRPMPGTVGRSITLQSNHLVDEVREFFNKGERGSIRLGAPEDLGERNRADVGSSDAKFIVGPDGKIQFLPVNQYHTDYLSSVGATIADLKAGRAQLGAIENGKVNVYDRTRFGLGSESGNRLRQAVAQAWRAMQDESGSVSMGGPQWMLDLVTGAMQQVGQRLRGIVDKNRIMKSAAIIGASRLLRNRDWRNTDQLGLRDVWDEDMKNIIGPGVAPALDRIWKDSQAIAKSALDATMRKYPDTQALIAAYKEGRAGEEWYADFRNHFLTAFGNDENLFRRFVVYYSLTSAGNDALGGNLTAALNMLVQERANKPYERLTGWPPYASPERLEQWRTTEGSSQLEDAFIDSMGNKQRDFVRALINGGGMPVVDGQIARTFGFPNSMRREKNAKGEYVITKAEKQNPSALPKVNDIQYNLMQQSILHAVTQLEAETGMQIDPAAFQAAVWHAQKAGQMGDAPKQWSDVMGKLNDSELAETTKIATDWMRSLRGEPGQLKPDPKYGLALNDEASIQRFMADPNGEPYAIVSGYHGDKASVLAKLGASEHPHLALIRDVVSKGIYSDRAIPMLGKYNGVAEPSLLLLGVEPQVAMELARKYGQESVLTRDGLIDTNPMVTRQDLSKAISVDRMRDLTRPLLGVDGIAKMSPEELRDFVHGKIAENVDSLFAKPRGFVSKPTGRVFTGADALSQSASSEQVGGVPFHVELVPVDPSSPESVHPAASQLFGRVLKLAAKQVQLALAGHEEGFIRLSRGERAPDGTIENFWDPTTKTVQEKGQPTAPDSALQTAAMQEIAKQSSDPVRAAAGVLQGRSPGQVRYARPEPAPTDIAERVAQATGQSVGALLRYSPFLHGRDMMQGADSLLRGSASRLQRMAESVVAGKTDEDDFRTAVNRHMTLVYRIAAADQKGAAAEADLREMMQTGNYAAPKGLRRFNSRYDPAQLATDLAASKNPAATIIDNMQTGGILKQAADVTRAAKLASLHPVEKKGLGDIINAFLAPVVTAHEGVMMGEGLSTALAQAHGELAGIHTGVAAFVRAMRGLSDKSVMDDPSQREAMSWAGMVMRPLAAFTDMFHEISRRGYIYKMAMRRALAENTPASELENKVAAYAASPDKDTLAGAEKFGKQQTFVEDLGGMAQNLLDWRNSLRSSSGFRNQIGNLILMDQLPFVKVPLNLVKWATRYSPAGFIEAGLAHLDKDPNMLEGYARAMVGTEMMVSFAAMTMAGMITGNGPSDPKARALWLRSHNPNSIHLPFGVDFNYAQLHPIAPLLTAAATAVESIQAHEKPAEMAMDELQAVGHILTTLPFIYQAGTLYDMVSSHTPGEAGYHVNQLAQRIGMSFLPIPSLAHDVRDMVDPWMRQTKSIPDAIAGQLPGLSTRVPLRTDIAGQPIQQGAGMLTPLVPGSLVARPSDPVADRLHELKLSVPVASTKVTIHGKQYTLTSEQQNELKEEIWKRVNRFVAPYLGSAGDMPPDWKRQFFQKMITAQAKEAHSTMVPRWAWRKELVAK